MLVQIRILGPVSQVLWMELVWSIQFFCTCVKTESSLSWFYNLILAKCKNNMSKWQIYFTFSITLHTKRLFCYYPILYFSWTQSYFRTLEICLCGLAYCFGLLAFTCWLAFFCITCRTTSYSSLKYFLQIFSTNTRIKK